MDGKDYMEKVNRALDKASPASRIYFKAIGCRSVPLKVLMNLENDDSKGLLVQAITFNTNTSRIENLSLNDSPNYVQTISMEQVDDITRELDQVNIKEARRILGAKTGAFGLVGPGMRDMLPYGFSKAYIKMRQGKELKLIAMRRRSALDMDPRG